MSVGNVRTKNNPLPINVRTKHTRRLVFKTNNGKKRKVWGSGKQAAFAQHFKSNYLSTWCRLIVNEPG